MDHPDAPGATAPQRHPRPRLPRTVLALGLTSFFTDIGSEMIFPLLPVFIASLGAAPAYLGLIEGIAEATSSVLKLASGYAADRVPTKKPMVLFGYALSSMVRPLVAVAVFPWHVMAVRVTDRVGKGIRTSPRDALIASSVSSHQAGRAFGFHRAMDHAGAVVGPLIATSLLSLGWQLREVFWLAAVPGALSLLCVIAIREVPRDADATTKADRASTAPVTAPSHDRPALPHSLRGYFAVLTLFCLGGSTDAFLLLRARDVGVPVASLPLLWMALHVSKLVSSYIGGDLSDRVGRTQLIVGGWVIYALTYLGLAFTQSPTHVWLLFLLYGVHYGLTEPAEKALVKDLAPSAVQSRAFGVYNFIFGVSAIPAGVLTGWLWQTWSPQLALSVSAAIAAVSAVALVVWKRTQPSAPRATASS